MTNVEGKLRRGEERGDRMTVVIIACGPPPVAVPCAPPRLSRARRVRARIIVCLRHIPIHIQSARSRADCPQLMVHLTR